MNKVKLNPMSDAPRDGFEILAYHDSGIFHPVKWSRIQELWRMRWDHDYGQHDDRFLGWVHFPEVDKN